MTANKFWDSVDYNISNMQENIEIFFYSMACFIIPFTLGHPQWIVGTLVNASLFLAAFNIKRYKVLPVILLPSIAVLTKGMIFGPMTIYLIYMIPVIWAGNWILVAATKYLTHRFNLNKPAAMGISAVVKTSLLFSAAFIMHSTGIIPAVFLTTMGLFQLYTAIAGGVVAYAIQTAKKKLLNT